jgi:hypothetical protein
MAEVSLFDNEEVKRRAREREREEGKKTFNPD